MRNNPMLPLSRLLIRRKDGLVIEPDKTYARVTIKMNGKGIFLRDRVAGNLIGTKNQFRIAAGQLLLSKIDARNGAFGIVPPECDNAIITGNFWAFDVNRALVNEEMLNFFTKTALFRDLCVRASEGSTNRRYLQEAKFLGFTVSFPALSEQKRVVDWMRRIEDKERETRKAVEAREKLVKSFYDSMTNKIFKQPQLQRYQVQLGALLDSNELLLNNKTRNPQNDEKSDEFLYLDISSVERGPSVINNANSVKSIEAPSRARRVMRYGDVVFSCVRPNLRAIAKIGKNLDNQICSTGFAVFTCGKNILPDFLLYQLSSGYFIDQCVTRGGHYPAINDANLRKTSLIIPPVDVQEKVIMTLAAITTLQKKISVENEVIEKKLNALMPSVLDKAFKGEL